MSTNERFVHRRLGGAQGLISNEKLDELIARLDTVEICQNGKCIRVATPGAYIEADILRALVQEVKDWRYIEKHPVKNSKGVWHRIYDSCE